MSERRAFGDRARRQRERRGVSLDAIAKATKVSAALFAGLERGDCSRWPGGVYSRAYVRAYAEAIGLDPDEAVEDFTAAFADTACPEGAANPPKRVRAAVALRLSIDDEPDKRHARGIRRALLGTADFILAFALAWFVHLLLDTSLWTTVGLALAYQAVARAVTDEPFVAWIAGRFRPAPQPPEEEVAVSDVARTTA